jgi:hypothetical protein
MAEKPLKNQDIVDMLSELRKETPEYPPELLRSRKTAFQKKVVDLNISGGNQSGKGVTGGFGGQTSGGGIKWAGLSGGATATGSSTKTAVAFGVIVVLLTMVYLLRAQIVEVLVENEIINVEETAAPSIEFAPTEQATATPTPPAFRVPATEDEATNNGSGDGVGGVAPGSGDNNNSGGTNSGGESITSSNPDLVTATPNPGISQAPRTPTPEPPRGLVGRLQYLVCVLRNGADQCR